MKVSTKTLSRSVRITCSIRIEDILRKSMPVLFNNALFNRASWSKCNIPSGKSSIKMLAWMGGRRRKLAQLAKARKKRQPACAARLTTELTGARARVCVGWLAGWLDG